MSLLSKISHYRLKFFLWIGLPIIAAMGILYGSTDLGPAWKAHGGGGVKGTFTAVHEECGKRSCSFHGDWVATEGGAKRTDVILYDEPDSLRVGGTVEALDSGARNGVFASAGGSTYLLVTAITLGGGAAGIGWIFFLFRTFTRRKQHQPA